MPRTKLGLEKAFASSQGKGYNIVYKYNMFLVTQNSGKKSFIHSFNIFKHLLSAWSGLGFRDTAIK